MALTKYETNILHQADKCEFRHCKIVCVAYEIQDYRISGHTRAHTHTHTHTRTHHDVSATVSGHGKTKSYLHRFKLIDNLMCRCNEGARSPEHLIYDSKILEIQSKTLKHQIMTSRGTWPTTNNDLVAKYSHEFSRFIRSVDFYKLQ
jgi:hypothetical protein